MNIEREALAVILENQARLADMIANSQGFRANELQDVANRLAVESSKSVKALRASDRESDAP